MADSQDDVARRIDGPVTIEIDDLEVTRTSSADQPGLPRELKADAAALLTNGWLRVENPEQDDPEAVDYYPPERVNGVFAVEE